MAPVFIASNEAVLLPERSNFQKIIPVESCKSAMLLEDNKVNASKRKNAVNWALVIFVCGAVVLFSWGIIAIYRKFLGDENNHGELARYSQAAANHSCNIVLANGEGVLIKA